MDLDDFLGGAWKILCSAIAAILIILAVVHLTLWLLLPAELKGYYQDSVTQGGYTIYEIRAQYTHAIDPPVLITVDATEYSKLWEWYSAKNDSLRR